MHLFLDADGDPHNGWNGYDVRVSGSGDLEKYQDGAWKEAGTVEYKVDGEELMITIPRKLVAAFSGRLDFEFKWSDNMQDEQDPLDWYINGDAAPGRSEEHTSELQSLMRISYAVFC